MFSNSRSSCKAESVTLACAAFPSFSRVNAGVECLGASRLGFEVVTASSPVPLTASHFRSSRRAHVCTRPAWRVRLSLCVARHLDRPSESIVLSRNGEAVVCMLWQVQ